MAFLAGDDAVFAKFADFHRHSAAVDTQIVRKSLTVIGDGEGTGFILLGLHKQVGHQLFPGGPVRGDLNFLVEDEILGRYHLEKIENHPAVKRAGTGTADCESAAVDEHDPAVLSGK